MTPLNIATYAALEDLVLDSLCGSFPAAAHVSGQLLRGCSAYQLLGRRTMTPAIGVDLSEHLAYSTLKGAANRSLGHQIRRSLYLLIPEAGNEIILGHVT